MSIETILNEKNNYLDGLLIEFEKEFTALSRYIKPRLAALIRQGVPEREAVAALPPAEASLRDALAKAGLKAAQARQAQAVENGARKIA